MNRFASAAVALLLATNAVVLGGVAYNRSGEPVATIELTERELSLGADYRDVARKENSGVSLALTWQVLNPSDDDDYYSRYNRQPPWLDTTKMEDLGFDFTAYQNDDGGIYRTPRLKKEVVLVLEYDGETYRQAVALAEQRLADLQVRAQKVPDDKNLAHRLEYFAKDVAQLKTTDSRLFALDAGTDRHQLRQQYADQGKYLLVNALIGVWRNQSGIKGYIEGYNSQQVHVPLPHSALLSPLERRPARYDPQESTETAPRYRVTLNSGQRLEPWVEAVTPMDDISPM